MKNRPTLDELSEALDSLATGKAHRKDGIPAEVLKYCKGSLITELLEILCLCWREGEVPQDTLYWISTQDWMSTQAAQNHPIVSRWYEGYSGL